MTWAVEFYEEEDGSAAVEEFLAQLPKQHRNKALAIVKRLEEAGPTLPFPYSSQVKGKIRELRTQHGKDRIRILYFADRERRFILLHAFIKRTAKLSERDIETAERRMKKHERKIGMTGRKGPETGARKRRRPTSGMGKKNWDQFLAQFLEELIHGTGTRNTEIRYQKFEGGEQIEFVGEHGEGKVLWKQERRPWFEGKTFCGAVQFDLAIPEDIRPILINHSCEDSEMCFLKEFMDEIGIKLVKKDEKWFVM